MLPPTGDVLLNFVLSNLVDEILHTNFIIEISGNRGFVNFNVFLRFDESKYPVTNI